MRELLVTVKSFILQPRRLPTRMLAARVAQERNVDLGKESDTRSGSTTSLTQAHVSGSSPRGVAPADGWRSD